MGPKGENVIVELEGFVFAILRFSGHDDHSMRFTLVATSVPLAP